MRRRRKRTTTIRDWGAEGVGVAMAPSGGVAAPSIASEGACIPASWQIFSKTPLKR